MLSFKKILCPIDFSEASLESLKTACDMAAQFKAELLLLYVRPMTVLPPEVLGMPGFNFVQFERQQSDEAQRRLEGIARGQVPGTLASRVLLREGDAGHEILQTAADEKVDIIVIATHGMTGWRHYLYGSVTQRVLQNTPCSVLVVRSASPRSK